MDEPTWVKAARSRLTNDLLIESAFRLILVSQHRDKVGNSSENTFTISNSDFCKLLTGHRCNECNLQKKNKKQKIALRQVNVN